MASQRQRQIIELLQSHKTGLSGNDLSNFLGVSSRTIRTDIKALEGELQAYGAAIHANTRNGYSLEITDEALFAAFIGEAAQGRMDSSENRVDAIIRSFFLSTLQNASLTQQQLADSLYVSLSTLKSDMKEAKERLAEYGLTIGTYKTEGMRLEGEEEHIRNFVAQYNFIQRSDASQVDYFQRLFPDIDIPQLLDVIICVSDSYQLHLTDMAIHNLVVHTAIAIGRAQQGHTMTYTLRQTKNLEKTKEFEVATSMFEEIFRKTSIDVAAGEIYYLTQHLMASKKYIDGGEGADQKMQELVMKIIRVIDEHVNIDFSQDQVLIEWLSVHLQTAIPRMKFQMNIRNDVLEVVKSEYPLAFQIAVIASSVIEKEEKVNVNENEIGYIAIHFGAALNRIDIKNDMVIRRALIVCASGMGTALLLKTRLESYFKDRIIIVDTVPGYTLTEDQIHSVDMILTTIPLPQFQSDRIIPIQHLLDNEELQQLEQRFYLMPHGIQGEITSFFKADCFYTDRHFDDRASILNFLTDQLKEKGLMTEAEKASVFEREEASPTEIGNLVAIPHPIYGDPPESRIAILILDKPVVWEKERVQLVFLLNIAKDQISSWQSIFLKLFTYLVKNDGVKEMLREPTYEAFIRNFTRQFNT
ncbi:BglG family transcription antiterminator [Megasphaera massiliensis]|uniref:BglG family transcription antiterminator n=1 Tax=Megasphaera massiliensis TaxID=1232428 RepID=UPI00399C139A